MKQATTALRALQPATRALSTSACACNVGQASSSSKFTTRPGESTKDAFKRNLEEVRAWRRRQDAIKNDLPIYIPSTVTGPRRAPRNNTRTSTNTGPGKPREASLSTLLASGAALGHATSLQNVPYSPYIYGTRAGLSIIDLDKTLPLLRRAAALVRDVVKADGTVLFLGTRPAHKSMLDAAQKRLEDNGSAVNKWLAGTLTNAETFFGTEPIFNGSFLPSLVVVLNPSENLGAIRECTARNVPTVGIVDSDTDPRIVTYPIPANMESVRTAELVLGTLSYAGQEGRRLRLAEADRAQARRERDAEWRRKLERRREREAEAEYGEPAEEEL